MSPYGNLAGDKSENNSFKMARGKVKGKNANISEIIRETVFCFRRHPSLFVELIGKEKIRQTNVTLK